MDTTMSAIHWGTVQQNLPFIALGVVVIPLLMMLYSDFLRTSARSAGKRRQSVRVVSGMTDKNGTPIFVDLFGQPIEQPIPVEARTRFAARRDAALLRRQFHR